MIKYPKIESLFNRDEKTFKFKIGDYRLPEFEYLADNKWLFTEKIDGTNIRVEWDGEKVRLGGRTDNAQIPVFLLDKLNELFPPEKFKMFDSPICLFGEGYGAKIQRGGKYILDGVGFVLFDVLVSDWWLKWEDICNVAYNLQITHVPVIDRGTLIQATDIVTHGLDSQWGSFQAEGLVCRPAVDLNCRNGDRIIVKLKTKDF